MEGFYVMAFATVSASIRAEKLAEGRFKTMVIPTPAQISKNCGFALRFLDGERQELAGFQKELTVPAVLYFMGHKKPDGSRECTLVGGNAWFEEEEVR